MPNKSNTVARSIENARQSSVQTRAHAGENGSGMLTIVPAMFFAGLYVPPWWSPARDSELRRFWKQSDHLAGTVYTMTAKMTAIPKKVVAVDATNRKHVAEAEMITEVLDYASEYGEGWTRFYSAFVEDLLTQDNGAFAEVIGAGDPNGPLEGRPFSVSMLDASRCQRTGNPEYPVLYVDNSGRTHRLHYTRVMYASQMPSPNTDMHGVGFCAVSRSINVVQTLVDITVYKQEKLGSRPHQSILITQGGLDPGDVASAFQLAEQEMNNRGLSRYSKVVLTGSSTIMDANIREISLSSLPDGFDEYNSTVLGMAAIALAFGVDAREIFPMMTGSASRADALIQHIKQRGKGPGQILETTEQLFNQKFLPPYLKLVFDFQDDAQDRQAAEIKKIRQERYNYAITSGTMDVRTTREQMVEDGDLTRAQFERLELDDGRLPDGSLAILLFYSTDMKERLNIGVEDPMDVDGNNAAAVLQAIKGKRAEAMRELANAKNDETAWKARLTIAALDALKREYETDGADADAEAVEQFSDKLQEERSVDLQSVNEGSEMSMEIEDASEVEEE